MKVAVVGATGLVGGVMMKILEERKFPVTELIPVSTYQSVSGTGKKAVDQLMNERGLPNPSQGGALPTHNPPSHETGGSAYRYRIDLNVLPQIDVFLDNGYTKEEMKMVNETRKILRDDSIRITSTTVRIPVIGGHSEAVNVEFEKDFSLVEVRSILQSSPGVIVVDDPAVQQYP